MLSLRKLLYLFLSLFLSLQFVSAQEDTLRFINGDEVVGEIKSMDRGVIKIETDYSDSDFKIEWEGIQYISTQTVLMVTLTDNSKLYGNLHSTDSAGILVMAADSSHVIVPQNDIVYLSPVEKKFLDRFSAAIDIGYSLTRANNLDQLTTRSKVGYRAPDWSTDASFNTLRSTQDDVDPIQRSDGAFSIRYILLRSWYPMFSLNFLSNTEQQLQSRLNVQLGLGKFFIRTNAVNWGMGLGLNRNVERYTNETPDRDTWEGYIGMEADLYDIGDFNLLSKTVVYVGVTEQGRYRSDNSLDIKYDLPFDFYIKVGGSLNYDNQPAEGSGEFDYVFQTGFGWEW